MTNVKIGNKEIKEGRCFVIAEAGVNHNGSLKTALKMIDVAKEAGADAVKFETFRGEQVTLDDVPMAEYQKKNTGKVESQLAMLKKLELNEKFYPQLIAHAKKKGIIFLSTPHGGFESVDFLQKLGVPAFKFGSGDLNNLPVLKYAAKYNKPMFVSTGMATMSEIKEAVETIKKTGNNKIVLMHCTSNYPCSYDEVNLMAMLTLKNKFRTLVGYSDHTVGEQVSVMAATLGAVLIEKHFTLDKNMKGPDHKASIEPEGLKKMIEAIRSVNVILGSFKKVPTKGEVELRAIARKSLVSLKNIKKGEKFTYKNVGIKRPGNGLEPKVLWKILGKKSRKDIKANALISNMDF